ncbi:hypothetical protein [Streptomyces microflavus]|uniref:hypothetical protein n=1 Tax=Streptomyces microflavus TaxID=1919 RepID=UPI002E33385F|nr:hypothetical protein [Streptomyces microflavus]
MSPYLMSTSTLAALSDGDDAATHVSAMWRREHITVAQAEEAAVGPAPVDVFSGDAATIHAEVRQLRADLIATDINVMWDEKRGLSPGEIVTRYVAARGDHGTQHWLRGLAVEHDAGNPFGPRVVDELDGIDGVHTLAA